MNASTPSTQHQTLRDQLVKLQAAMQEAGMWSSVAPSDEALASTMPFMYDTLKVEEWLQWVFLPRLHALIDGNLDLPSSCSVEPLAEHEWTQRSVAKHGDVLRLIKEIDKLLTIESKS